MKIIIFEGVASSGKTTIEKKLAEKLGNASIISEGETLMPLIDNRDSEVAVKHLETVLNSLRDQKHPYVIVDRFHLTHAFRTKSSLEAFSLVEKELQKIGDVLLVLLTMDAGVIKQRITETAEYRGDNWKKGFQGNMDEKVQYYVEQQKQLEKLAAQSLLPVLILDTTRKEWDKYADTIAAHLGR